MSTLIPSDRLAASSKRLILVFGFLLLTIAEILFESQKTLFDTSFKADVWNAVNKLEIENHQNVYAAIPYLLGGILAWWIFLKTPSPNTTLDLSFTTTALKNNKTQFAIIALCYGIFIHQLTTQSHHTIHQYAWIFLISWASVLIWKADKQNNIDLSIRIDKADLLNMMALFAIGIAIGTFALSNLPKQIISDEIPFWDAGSKIARYQYKGSIFETGVFTFPLSTSIYQAWIMRLFGITIWGWRFSSVLAGVAAVFPLYLLAKEWFGKRVAIVTIMLMLTNPYFLAFCRLGYNNSQAIFPITFAIYLWDKGIRQNSQFFLWMGGITAGAGFYSYFAAWLGAAVIGLSILYLLALRNINFSLAVKLITILMVSFAAMAAPRIAYNISSGDSAAFYFKFIETSFINIYNAEPYYYKSEITQIMPLIKVGTSHYIFFHPRLYIELLTRGAIRTIFAIFDPYIPTEHHLVSGFAGRISPIFLVIGILTCIRQYRNPQASLLIIWLASGLTFLSILNAYPPRQTHLIVTIPAMALITAIGLDAAASQFTHKRKNKLVVIACIISIILIVNTKVFFTEIPERFPPSFQDYAIWAARSNDENTNYVISGESSGWDEFKALVYLKFINGRVVFATESTLIQTAKSHSNKPTAILLEEDNPQLRNELYSLGYRQVADPNATITPGYLYSNSQIFSIPNTGGRSEINNFLQSKIITPLIAWILLLFVVLYTNRFEFHDRVHSKIEHK